MIKFRGTLIGSTYGRYAGDYLTALLTRKMESYSLGDSAIIGINRTNGMLPRSNVPYVFQGNLPENTLKKTVVVCDGTGIRDVEADLRYINTIVTAMWEDDIIAETFPILRNLGTKAYMNWVVRGLAGRFNLSYEDCRSLNILFAIYYFTAHSTPEDVLAKSNYKNYSMLSEITGYPTQLILDMVDKYELAHMSGNLRLTDLIELARKESDDLRNKLSVSSVQSVLAGSWYGEGGPFYCNLALEYPPMFYTLLYFSLVDTGYQKTRLGVRIKEFVVGRNRDLGSRYTEQFHAYIKGINPQPIR